MTRSSCRAAIAVIASMAQARPAKCTGRMARVRGVIRSSMPRGSMFMVTGSMSANTGVAPEWMIALTVAQKVSGVVITSSPGCRPAAIMLTCSAAVQELTAAALPGSMPL